MHATTPAVYKMLHHFMSLLKSESVNIPRNAHGSITGLQRQSRKSYCLISK